jgi:cephalosporin hydroxylase
MMRTIKEFLRRTIKKIEIGQKVELGSFRAIFAQPQLSEAEKKIVQDFSNLYYSKLDGGRGLYTIVLSWLGYELFKCPLDLWIYQEVIVRDKPDLIIEIGTYKGGSALFLANVCDLVGGGEIVTVDIDPTHQNIRPKHPRINYLLGSSTDSKIFSSIEAMSLDKNVLVIIDGDHRCDNVLSELRMYSKLTKVGGLLIVEDTNINGHPTYPDFGPGPWEAVDAFLNENPSFIADRTCERFMLTMNPRGYLRRVT